MASNFDADTPVYIFTSRDMAVAYMHYLWEDYYNTEIAEDSDLIKNQCFHEIDYAKVEWTDGCKTEFCVTYVSSYDDEFFKGNWEKYLPEGLA